MTRTINKKSALGATDALLKAATKSAFPSGISPMLATLIDQPFDDPAWSFEIKWDGYRALAFLNKGEVTLRSRNDKSFNEKFYPVFDELKKWKVNAVFDGEIVVTDYKGTANFSALQNWRSEADGRLTFYVFDLLWLNGKDLTSLPLTDRRALLRSVIPLGDEFVRLSEELGRTGKEAFDTALKLGLEGIMA